MASHSAPLSLRQLAGSRGGHAGEAGWAPRRLGPGAGRGVWGNPAGLGRSRRENGTGRLRQGFLGAAEGTRRPCPEKPPLRFPHSQGFSARGSERLQSEAGCSPLHARSQSGGPHGRSLRRACSRQLARRGERWQAQAGAAAHPGSDTCRQEEFLQVAGVSYRPSGSSTLLLRDVDLSLPNRSLGLIYGRSGSGKTTLLQVLAGLATPASGRICVGPPSRDGSPRQPCTRAELASLAGIVFQFPERYFLAGSVLEELTFGWPRRPQDLGLRQSLAMRLQASLFAVGLTQLQLDADPRALSGGNQRRLALATQLVRLPQVLLLDEPLAGLDWRARADVVKLLADLKKERTIVVVSHDLRELSPLVDRSWHMTMGGRLEEVAWPPDDFEDQAVSFQQRAALAKKG